MATMVPPRALRFAALIAGLWAGLLLCIGALTAPSAFAMLPGSDAGRMLGRVFALEARISLGLAVVLFAIERGRSRAAAAAGQGSVFSANLLLLLGTLFCTVAGYFALQPLMEAARAGQGALSFGAIHAISSSLFALKGLLVLALAWRLGGVAVSSAATS